MILLTVATGGWHVTEDFAVIGVDAGVELHPECTGTDTSTGKGRNVSSHPNRCVHR